MAAFYKSFNKQEVYWHKGNNIKKSNLYIFFPFLKGILSETLENTDRYGKEKSVRV